MTSFADRLADSVRRTRTPVLVGLDPRTASLPAPLRPKESTSDLAAQARAFEKFCCGVIDVVAPLVPAVKPQAAFFEALGPAGMSALGAVIKYARRRGLLVVLDGKRGDIGSTAEGYAQAYLGADERSAWGADALTVNPYLGLDALSPFVDVARAQDAGIFVLVKTSNPGGGRFQDLIADGEPVYRHVAREVEAFSAADAASSGYGSTGAVVGATYPEQLAEMRAAMPHAWILVPGYGSQGGTARDVAAGFDSRGLGAIVNNSRGIIFAHARREYAALGDSKWQAAVEAATRAMIAELAADTSAGKLGQ